MRWFLKKILHFTRPVSIILCLFYGKAHIAYIPDGKVVGLSKLARTVEVYAKRPQIQEQLTAQIADALMEYLKPQGAMVMLEAEHMCNDDAGGEEAWEQNRNICDARCF